MSDDRVAPPDARAPATSETATAAPDPGGAAWDAIVGAIERPFDRFLAAFKVPVLAGLLVVGATFWLRHALVSQEKVLIGRVTMAEAMQLRNAMAHAIGVRERALGDLAYRWERRPPDAEAWSMDAALLIQRDLQFRAIAWLNDTLGTRWTRPTTATLTLGTLDAIDEPTRRQVAGNLSPRNRAVISHSYLLVDAHRQVLVRALMEWPGGGRSALIGVIRPVDLFDAVLGPEIKNGWAIAVYEGPYLLYGPQWTQSGPEAQWTREAEVDGDEWTFTMRVWPSEELAATLRSPAPRVVWIAGLALALLVAIGVRRIQTLSRRVAGAGPS